MHGEGLGLLEIVSLPKLFGSLCVLSTLYCFIVFFASDHNPVRTLFDIVVISLFRDLILFVIYVADSSPSYTALRIASWASIAYLILKLRIMSGNYLGSADDAMIFGSLAFVSAQFYVGSSMLKGRQGYEALSYASINSAPLLSSRDVLERSVHASHQVPIQVTMMNNSTVSFSPSSPHHHYHHPNHHPSAPHGPPHPSAFASSLLHASTSRSMSLSNAFLSSPSQFYTTPDLGATSPFTSNNSTVPKSLFMGRQAFDSPSSSFRPELLLKRANGAPPPTSSSSESPAPEYTNTTTPLDDESLSQLAKEYANPLIGNDDFLRLKEEAEHDTGGWELLQQQNDVTIWTKKEPFSSMPLVKMEATFPNASVETISNLLMDHELRRSWERILLDSYLIENIADGFDLIYSAYRLPIIGNRDYFEQRMVKNLAESGVRLIIQRSIPSAHAKDRPGFIRGESRFTGYILQSSEGSSSSLSTCRMTFVTLGDAKGSVPDYTGPMLFDWVSWIREACRTYK